MRLKQKLDRRLIPDSSLTAVGLVCSIFTVVLFVASPAHGNTATAGTGEEVHRTFQLPLLCNGHSESRNV